MGVRVGIGVGVGVEDGEHQPSAVWSELIIIFTGFSIDEGPWSIHQYSNWQLLPVSAVSVITVFSGIPANVPLPSTGTV